MEQPKGSDKERITKLEAFKEYQEKKLDKFEAQLDNIEKDVAAIREVISAHNGATTMKNRIGYVALSFVTIITALGLHTFFYKFFGIEL